MTAYRTIFDVVSRVPEAAIGVTALVVLGAVVLVGLVDADLLLVRWPVLLGATVGLLGLEGALSGTVATLPFLLFPAGAAAVEEAWARYPALAGRPGHGVVSGAAATMGVVAGLAFAAFQGVPMLAALDLLHAEAAGNAQVAEGPVEIYFEDPTGKNECVRVQTATFCYSDWDVAPAFNRTRALGGPMRDGLQVRITSVGDKIIRLEVANTAATG